MSTSNLSMQEMYDTLTSDMSNVVHMNDHGWVFKRNLLLDDLVIKIKKMRRCDKIKDLLDEN